ncbi:MAG: FAD-dependent oxidoreductase [Bacteroidota bacterium]
MKRRELIKLIGMAPLLKMGHVAEASTLYAKDPANEAAVHLLVYGATPGGVACAVRAAREGLKVLLVNPTEHLGGMFASGLGIMDTLYNGSRAPLYDEFRQSIYDYYRLKYGTDSPQYENSGPGISKTKYEAHVAEQLINVLLAAETNITIIKGFYPVSADKNNKHIKSIGFKMVDGQETMYKEAMIFADCSYEGDLLAIAGAAFRMGRESKNEFGEKYAGVIYSKDVEPGKAVNGLNKDEANLIRNLNLYRYKESGTLLMMPESTGEAHSAIQGFNLRSIITDDPGNRLLPAKPANYDPAYFKDNYTHKIEKLTLSRPNQKSSLNFPKMLGLQNKYVEGDWTERKKIIEQYRNEVTGLLYFRQNDLSLTAEVREHWRKYGLAKDEFTDNGYMPYELYVREARRMKGKIVFTEHDARLAKGLKRAPVHTDSIGVTEWFLDSHACTDQQVKGSKDEGEVMLKSETVPGQIPLATIFPSDIDNLIVPVCLSASHIGWGAIRLEPVWMEVGEVAGYVAAEAFNQGITPALVNPDELVKKLALNRFMISFFNDMEGREYSPWYPAVQYLGTKGFFGTYEAQPNKKLTKILAERWADHLQSWKQKGDWDANNQALKTAKAEETDGESLKAAEFVTMIEKALRLPNQLKAGLKKININDKSNITRGDAARLIFEAIAMVSNDSNLKK